MSKSKCSPCYLEAAKLAGFLLQEGWTEVIHTLPGLHSIPSRAGNAMNSEESFRVNELRAAMQGRMAFAV